MDKPEFLEMKGGYAHFRPEGKVSLKQAIALVGEAIKYCREHEIPRLLADTTQLTGFPPPTIVERYWIAQEWGKLANGKLAFGMVVPNEVIDPDKFEVIAATNAGQIANVFTSETEALAWLLQQMPSEEPSINKGKSGLDFGAN